MTITITADKRARIYQAITDTNKFIESELAYPEHLQNKEMMATYRQHLDKLHKMLDQQVLVVE